MSEALHARCFCGAIRFTASAEPLQVSWCHCRDCRRQTGAPAVVWAGFRVEDLTIEGTPTRRQSSEHVVRAFCADCGTPLTYEHDELRDEVYIHAGLFDEADRLVPDRHGYVTSKLFWMHLEDGLDAFEATTRERTPGPPQKRTRRAQDTARLDASLAAAYILRRPAGITGK